MPDRDNYKDFYIEASESIKAIFDLTSKIDARVKNLAKGQEETDEELIDQAEDINEIRQKLLVLETKLQEGKEGRDGEEENISSIKNKLQEMELKVQAVSIAAAGHENRWKSIITFVVQIIWVVLASYILYKMGIQTPNLP
jgi:uncharacterized coiled-coil DUF342 family protein